MADPFSRFIASESRRFLSGFDSSTTMLRALAAGLQRRSLPACGLPKASQAIMLAGGHLPTGVRRSLYEWGGELEAVRTSVLPLVRAEDIVRWVIGHYPAPRYPGAMFGSSNGAAVHLALALGFPWLPQTFLIPIRHRGIPPDDFRTSYRMGREEGPSFWGPSRASSFTICTIPIRTA